MIRGATALVIGILQPPGWEGQLVSLASDPQQPAMVRDYAVRGLSAAQTASGLEHLVRVGEAGYRAPWPAARTVLQSMARPAALPGLAVGATSTRWWIREAVAISIGRIGTDEAMELLERLADDGDSAVRKAAVSGLQLASRSDAVPPLLKLARDTDHEVRSRAVEVLSMHYPDVAVQPLIEAARPPATLRGPRSSRLWPGSTDPTSNGRCSSWRPTRTGPPGA